MMTGQDRTGKTSQIRRILKYLIDKPVLIIHTTSAKDLDRDEQKQFYQRNADKALSLITSDDSVNWVLDRCYLDNAVYSPIYTPEISSFYVQQLEQKYQLWDQEIYLIVLVDSSFKNLERDDGESYTTDAFFANKEMRNFIREFHRCGIKHKLLIDIKDKNIESVSKIILEFLRLTCRRNIS